MSSMEYWSGTITKCDLPENLKTLKDKIDYLVATGEHTLDFDFNEGDSYVDSDTLFIHKGEVYDLRNFNGVSEDECSAVRLDDKNIIVRLSFYNGGGCMTECLEEVLDSLDS